jgi:hypothetical protein
MGAQVAWRMIEESHFASTKWRNANMVSFNDPIHIVEPCKVIM